MKYPCAMIQDLLPLHLDGICSDESSNIIEQHLSECPDCKEYYNSMLEADKLDMSPHIADWEQQKAASFQSVRKRIFQKQIIMTVALLLLMVAISFTTAQILKSSVNIVEYQDNISVSMTDGNLTAKLQGSRISYVESKRVENNLFFYVSDTQWDALVTNRNMFSEYILCPADKNAAQITHVFYYTGDYTDIETMSIAELQDIMHASTLLWSK